MPIGFDFKKLERNLQKYKVDEQAESPDETGLANIFRYLWSHESINEINFDSFSKHDIDAAFDDLFELELGHQQENDEEFYVDPTSRFIIHYEMENTIFHFVKEQNKVYESDDEEIFI